MLPSPILFLLVLASYNGSHCFNMVSLPVPVRASVQTHPVTLRHQRALLQDESSNPQPTSAEIAAWVDETPIYVRDVEREVRRALRGRSVEGYALRLMKAQAVEQLVNRELILRKLAQDKLAASDADLQMEVGRMEEQLARTDRTLDQFLADSGEMTRDELERELKWRLSWRKYLNQYLTDENLQRFFDERRERFDGTRRRLRQIVWQVGADATEKEWSAQQEAAANVKQEIEASSNVADAFATAAAKYSDSPSGKDGGDVGWYTIDGELPTRVLEAAFSLQQGAVSAPIVSPYGVHLVQVTDVEPGELSWEQVRPQLEKAAALYLFDWLADQQRGSVSIRYAADYPHFEPGTKRLANSQDNNLHR